MEFSKQENWSGLPFPPPGDLFDPGIKPSLHWQTDSLLQSYLESPCMLPADPNLSFYSTISLKAFLTLFHITVWLFTGQSLSLEVSFWERNHRWLVFIILALCTIKPNIPQEVEESWHLAMSWLSAIPLVFLQLKSHSRNICALKARWDGVECGEVEK